MPFDAKQFVCRKLMVIGTAASVPALAGLLPDEQLSHMARLCTGTHPRCPGCGGAARLAAEDCLASSRWVSSVRSARARMSPAFPLWVKCWSTETSSSLVPQRSRSVTSARRKPRRRWPRPKSQAKSNRRSRMRSFACAESLLSAGKNLDALAIYKGLAAGDPPKHVKLAATRGMLACAGKK